MAFHGWLASLTEDVTAGDGLRKWTAAYYGLDIIYDNTGTNLVSYSFFAIKVLYVCFVCYIRTSLLSVGFAGTHRRPDYSITFYCDCELAAKGWMKTITQIQTQSGRGSTTVMASMAMAIALFRVLWPPVSLVIALFNNAPYTHTTPFLVQCHHTGDAATGLTYSLYTLSQDSTKRAAAVSLV